MKKEKPKPYYDTTIVDGAGGLKYCNRCLSSIFKNNSSKHCPECKKLRSEKK